MGFLSNLLSKLTGNSENQASSEPAASATTQSEKASIGTSTPPEHMTTEEAEEIIDEEYVEEHSSEEGDDFGPYTELAKNPTQQNLEEFWYQVFSIEDAAHKSEQALAQAFAERGIRDMEHFRQIRETFTRHFSHLDYFEQSLYNARGRQGKETLQAAAATHGQLFEPIDGVTIETYATIQARIAHTAGQGSQAIGKLLAEYKLDDERWKKVDAAWQERMRQSSDPMASMALLSKYGEAFAAAGQGKYGAAAQAGASSFDIHGEVGKAPEASAEPCSLERYAEIMGAQGAWAEQGKDINEMLKQVFGLTALDFSNISVYWGAKMQADHRLVHRLVELQDKYKAQYLGGGGDADDDLMV